MVFLLNKYGEIRSGWALLFVIVVYFALQLLVGLLMGLILAFIVIASGVDQTDAAAFMQACADLASSPGMIYLISYVSLLAVIGVLLLLFRILYRRPVAQMGLYRTGWLRQLLIGCLFGIVSIAAVVAILLLTKTASLSMNGSGSTSAWFIGDLLCGLILFTLVAFSEEILARGFMMTAMKTKPTSVAPMAVRASTQLV